MIAWAMLAMACRPEEHWRLVVDNEVVCGMLAERAAMRNATAEVGGERTLPTQMSCMAVGGRSCSELLSVVGSLRRTPRNTVERSVAGGC